MTETKLCFFCQKEKPAGPDSKALFSYFVCAECAEQMASGLPVMVVADEPAFEHQPPICVMETEKGQGPMYPTGEWAVYSHEAASRLFGPEVSTQAVLSGAMFLTQPVWDGVQEIYKKTMMPEDMELDNPEDAGISLEQAARIPTWTAFLYESDGITAADLSIHQSPEAAIQEASDRGWDEVVNDLTGEVVWKKGQA